MDTVDLKLAQDCESLAVAASEGVNWLKDAANQSPTVAQQAPSLISELQKVRNQSRKLARAARRRMCAGVFGPSQAGKSYLVSILASRDGRAVALDRLTLRLQTLPRREGYWLDTGMLKTG